MNRLKVVAVLFLALSIFVRSSEAEQSDNKQSAGVSTNFKIGPVPTELVRSLYDGNTSSYIQRAVYSTNGTFQNNDYDRPRESSVMEAVNAGGRNGNGRIVVPLFVITIKF